MLTLSDQDWNSSSLCWSPSNANHSSVLNRTPEGELRLDNVGGLPTYEAYQKHPVRILMFRFFRRSNNGRSRISVSVFSTI